MTRGEIAEIDIVEGLDHLAQLERTLRSRRFKDLDPSFMRLWEFNERWMRAWPVIVAAMGAQEHFSNVDEFSEEALDDDYMFWDLGDRNDPTHRQRDVASMMSKNPTSTWSASEAHRGLLDRGIEITPSAVRTLLQRMTERGTLKRVERGKYRLARRSET